MNDGTEITWHVLDVGSIWMKEFACALAAFVPTVNWWPVMRPFGAFERWERTEEWAEPPLTIRRFPLGRGYSRFPLSALQDLGRMQRARMLRAGSGMGNGASAAASPLICTTPYYAPVAECWPGPVIYYQTDLTFAYHGRDPQQIRALDRRLCRAATVVCPNSQRIAHYMLAEAGCDPAKIVVVPNATRPENVLAAPPSGPGPLPEGLEDLPRPIAGVLGNLAGNMDWELLLEAIERTPDYSWAFIGPYSMQIEDVRQRNARERVLAQGGRTRFIGSKPYGSLQGYARALDVAVLPYRRREPTFSGSSTRFYEHLAACRPIVATRGFEELLHKEPLLKLIDDARELIAYLRELRTMSFEDGWTGRRWEESRSGTWTLRAATVIRAIQSRSSAPIRLAELPAGVAEMIRIGSSFADFAEDFSLIEEGN